jgi:protein SCO1
MMLRRLAFLTVFYALAAAVGCGGGHSGSSGDEPIGPRAHRAKKPPETSVPETTDYPLKGVVKKVEKEREHVTIQHEAIPGFMDAMRMRFAYKDQAVLGTLEPGDQVEGTLRVERLNGVVNQYELRGLTVTQAATAVKSPALIPNISKKEAFTHEPTRRLEIGDAVPDFTMTSQDGKAVKLSDLRGHVVVLTFIYTRCPLPDFCPLMDKKFSDLAQRLSAFATRASKIRLISLSFDPEHDTPELLRKHAQVRGATPPLWSYAVASHSELAKIGVPLGLFYQPGDTEIAHNLCTAIIDPGGNLARLDVGTERNKWSSTDMQKTIYSLLPRTNQ